MHIVAGHLFADGKTGDIYFFGFGFTWVPWFFMLSGFVLFIAYERDPKKLEKNPLKYVERRSLTIYPFYAVSLLLAYGLAKTGNMGNTSVPDPGYLLASIWLAQSFWPTIPEFCLQMHCWFLSCLLVYWLFFPALAERLGKVKRIDRLLLLLAFLCSLPWIGLFVIPEALGEELDWYTAHKFRETGKGVDILVTFLKFHPLCYFHIFIFGMGCAKLRSLCRPSVVPESTPQKTVQPAENNLEDVGHGIYIKDSEVREPVLSESSETKGLEDRVLPDADPALQAKKAVDNALLPVSVALLVAVFAVPAFRPAGAKLTCRMSTPWLLRRDPKDRGRAAR